MTMPSTPQTTAADPTALATLTPSGKPPESRLSNARQAQELFSRLRTAAGPRLKRASVIQGMFDGNAPFDPSRLRSRNEGWRSNFSTQEGPSRKESAKSPFYDLITSAETFAECRTDETSPGVDAATASRVRSEEFDRLLRSYEDFEDEWWLMFDDMIGFNRGFFWFPHPPGGSWHFQQVPWWRVYFPDGTTVKRRNWNFFAIEHSWTVHELYSFVSHGAASSPGWNLRAVHQAIRNAAPAKLLGDGNDPMAVQKSLADSELFTSESSEVVRAASVYVQEFDGSWSRMVVVTDDGKGANDGPPSAPMSLVESQTASAQSNAATSRAKPTEWLYYKRGIADRVTQILCPFIYETSNGSVNSIKNGLGARIISVMQTKDRMRCGQSDNVNLRNSIILQPTSASSRAKTALLNIGPVTVVPDGFTVQQGTIFGDIEGTLAVNADLDRLIDVTTGTYRAQFEKPTGNPETATAAQQRFAMGMQLSDAAVRRFYVRADTFYYELYERVADAKLPDSSDEAVKEARAFQKRCRERGLSDRQISDCVKGRIRASRTVGNGSPVMRQQMLGAVSVLAMQGLLGPRGMQQWKTLYVAAHLGQAGVQALLPPEDTAQVPSRDEWDAVSENADAQQGSLVLLAPWQNHVIHAAVHMQTMEGAIASVEQGADPAMPFTFLQVMMPHIQQHIRVAAPEAVRKQLEAAYAELAKRATVVEKAAKERMQQQGQQQQASFEQQLKMQETQAKLAISQQKMEATLALKEQRQNAELGLKAQQQQSASNLQDAVTAAGVHRDTATTSADIALQGARTQSDIANATAKTTAQIENDRRKAEAQADAASNKPKPSGK